MTSTRAGYGSANGISTHSTRCPCSASTGNACRLTRATSAVVPGNSSQPIRSGTCGRGGSAEQSPESGSSVCGPPDDRHHLGHVRHAPRERPEVGESVGAGRDVRDAAERRLEADDAAEGRRDADRARAVGADRERAEPGGDRRGRAAAGATGREVARPRVTRRWRHPAHRARAPSVLGGGRLADHDRARRAQPCHDRCVAAWAVVDQQGSASRRQARGLDQVLHGDGDPEQRLPSPRRGAEPPDDVVGRLGLAQRPVLGHRHECPQLGVGVPNCGQHRLDVVNDQ